MAGWWTDRKLFLEQVKLHGSNRAISEAHGGIPSEWTVRRYRGIHNIPKYRQHGPQAQLPEAAADGSLTLDANDLNEVHATMRARGINPDDWIITLVVLNDWSGFYRTDEGTAETVPLKQLKITLRPKIKAAFVLPAQITKLPPIQKRIRPKRKARLIFVYGDDQRPNHDRGFEETKLTWIAETMPDMVIDLGDGMDAPTISDHKTNPAMSWPLQACLDSYGNWLYRLRNAVPDADITILADNHFSARLRDYQLGRAAALYGVHPAEIVGRDHDLEPLLSIRRMLPLNDLNITYVDPPDDTHYAESHIEVAPGLVALHGYRTGANVGRKLLDDYGCSIVYGHTHGQDVVVTDKKRRGFGERERLYALGVGCGANIAGGGGFAPGADWQNCALTITVLPSGAWTWDYLNYEKETLRWRDLEITAAK